MSFKKPGAGEVLGPALSEKAKAGVELKKEVGNNFLKVDDSGKIPSREERAKLTDKVSVLFQKSWKRWFSGDKAGFLPLQAKRLVDAGIANYTAGPVKRAFGKVKDAVSKPAEKTAEKTASSKG